MNLLSEESVSGDTMNRNPCLELSTLESDGKVLTCKTLVLPAFFSQPYPALTQSVRCAQGVGADVEYLVI